MGQDIGAAGWPNCGRWVCAGGLGYSTVQSSVGTPLPEGGDAVHTAHRDLPSDSGWHVYASTGRPAACRSAGTGVGCLTVDRDFCPPPAWVSGPRPPHNGGMFLLLNLAVAASHSPMPMSASQST